MPRSLVPIVIALLVLAGCTGDPPAPHPPAGAVLPADVFPALPDRGSGVQTTVEAMVGDGDTMLMVATVEGRTSVPVLRYSTDAGATWRDGELSATPASAPEVGEEAGGVAAVARRGTERAWLALGSKDEALFAWTSPDAQTWDRTPVTGIDPRKDERVFSMVGLSDGGFVAVGGRGHDDRIRPMAWTSPDGIDWTARTVAGDGVLNEVTARGDRVVAVGEHALARVTKGRSQVSLLFTSTDRGGSWRPVKVDEPATSGDFFSSLDHAVATDSGFVVGGHYFDEAERTYRPLLLSSRDLRSWKQVRRLPAAGEASEIDELLQLGSTTVAAQRVRTTGAKDELRVSYLFAGDQDWTRGAAPKAPQSTWAAAGAAAGPVAVFAIGVDGNPGQTRLWRFDSPAQVDEIELAAPAETRTRVEPVGLFVVDGAIAAHGRTQGVYVHWPADGDRFGAPVPIGVADNESVGDVAWSAEGGYLATGRLDGDHAFVLHSTDGASWKRTAPTVFNRVARYHSSSIDNVIWANGGWVVVGTRTSNADVRDSALVATSPDGVRWTPGRPAKVTARGDWYGRRDPLDDLNGLADRSRAMTGVTGGERGLVAVGSMGSGLSEPAAWVAPDGRTWRLVPLDHGDFIRAQVTGVQRVGGVLLGFGWALAKGTTRTTRAVWRSTDGGKHWAFTTFDGTFVSAFQRSSDHEFVQTVLSDDRRTLTLWRSADGLAWTSTPIPVDGLADGMEVSVEDALVHAGALHLLLTLRNRVDAVTVVQRVPL